MIFICYGLIEGHLFVEVLLFVVILYLLSQKSYAPPKRPLTKKVGRIARCFLNLIAHGKEMFGNSICIWLCFLCCSILYEIESSSLDGKCYTINTIMRFCEK